MNLTSNNVRVPCNLKYFIALQLYLFILLGICLRIMWLTPSTWKDRSDEMAKRDRDDAVHPPTPFTGRRGR